MTPGSGDVKVEKDATLDLPPGAYGKLEVEEGATLNLSAGSYAFKRIDVKKDAVLNLDVGGGPIVVRVEENVDLHEGVVMNSTGAASDILFAVAGDHVQLKKEGLYLGTFVAPDGHIDVGEGAALSGALYGHKVELKKRATVEADPAIALFVDLFVK
jgi:hypothetical protein